MPAPGSQIEDLFAKLKAYLNTSIELVRLKIVEKITLVISAAVSSILLVGVFLMVIILLSIGLALYFGNLLGNAYYGFFLMGGIYLLLGIIFILLRKKILKTPLTNWLIKNLMD